MKLDELRRRLARAEANQREAEHPAYIALYLAPFALAGVSLGSLPQSWAAWVAGVATVILGAWGAAHRVRHSWKGDRYFFYMFAGLAPAALFVIAFGATYGFTFHP